MITANIETQQNFDNLDELVQWADKNPYAYISVHNMPTTFFSENEKLQYIRVFFSDLSKDFYYSAKIRTGSQIIRCYSTHFDKAQIPDEYKEKVIY
jgi:hypothetical protein